MSASAKKIVIIDYKLGNLFSVNQALTNIGLNVSITSDPVEIETADALVLPGVGAFKDAMHNLRSMGLIDPIRTSINAGKPFLGICLGLQLLFTESEEFGYTEGLGIIKGCVRKFTNLNASGHMRKVPQIAWNKILETDDMSWKSSPLSNTRNGEFMYFVHSYFVDPEEPIALTKTSYDGHLYVSSILSDNIFACQFHPEKSAVEGLKIYNTWAQINHLK